MAGSRIKVTIRFPDEPVTTGFLSKREPQQHGSVIISGYRLDTSSEAVGDIFEGDEVKEALDFLKDYYSEADIEVIPIN